MSLFKGPNRLRPTRYSPIDSSQPALVHILIAYTKYVQFYASLFVIGLTSSVKSVYVCWSVANYHKIPQSAMLGCTYVHSISSAVVRACDIKVIEWLLRSGANPDICNSDGDTPLHACAMRKGIDPLIPGILLRFGANPNLKNRLGKLRKTIKFYKLSF